MDPDNNAEEQFIEPSDAVDGSGENDMSALVWNPQTARSLVPYEWSTFATLAALAKYCAQDSGTPSAQE